VVHPTHILVSPRVHRAHRLKSAGLVNLSNFDYRMHHLNQTDSTGTHRNEHGGVRDSLQEVCWA